MNGLLQDPAVAEFSQTQILVKTTEAAEKAWELLEAVCAGIRPGMTEAEATATVENHCTELGIEKHWHRPYIRFGEHSTLTFMDKPEGNLTLQENDIAYVDLGPIINCDGLEVEGDVGKTLVFGDSGENNSLFHDLKAQCARIDALARQYWRQNNPTGVELYEYMHQLTESAGYVFHLNPAGHLIGTFPHKGWKKGLNTYPYAIEPGIWILETQIRHPEQPYGAFQEAVLI